MSLNQKADRLGNIRLVGSDLDGTLTESKGVLSDYAMESLRAWRESGGLFAIVTGRPPGELRKVLEGAKAGLEWPYPDFVVCDERDIFDVHSGEWISVGDHRIQLEAELAYRPMAVKLTEVLLEEADKAGIHVDRSTDETEFRRGYVELRYPNPELAKQARSLVLPMLEKERSLMAAVRNNRLLAFRHPLSRKAFPLRLLAEWLGLTPYQVAAVGDSHNDLTMIDGGCGFLGAAVANADPDVADAVIKGGGIHLPKERSKGVGFLLEMLLDARGAVTRKAI